MRVVPPGWTLTTIAECTSAPAVYGILQPGPDIPEGIPYVRPTEIRGHSIDIASLRRTTPEIAANYKRSALLPGDVLLSIVGTIGKTAVVPPELAGANITQSSVRIRVPESVALPRYLAYHLQSPQLVAQFNAARLGTAVPRLNISHVRDLSLRLAPHGEQHRIVATIESHFSRLDAATATLERVQRNLERYRASVLKAAVEGRLVPTEAELARKEGRSYEPASALLKRILAERRRRWEEAELAKLKAKGKTPTDDRWKARYEEPAAPDVEGLPELPEGWCWASASALFWDAGYGTSSKCTHDAAGPAVLRIPNVQAQALELADLKFAVDQRALAADGTVAPGDFLFIRTNGSVSLIGRGAVVVEPTSRECYFASYLIRLRLVRVDQLWNWFAFAWHTSVVRDQLVRDAASSAGQHNVSLSAASKYAIPVPPSHEQARILAETDRLTTTQAQAVAAARQGCNRIRRLRQSILKWAFEGRLVDAGAAPDQPLASACPHSHPFFETEKP